MENETFEIVHTMTDWYDGPRRGVADFQGRPHLYECERDYSNANTYASTFLLTSIPQDLFLLAVEDWAIWLRWEAAFKKGAVTHESHPALPAERGRHIVLRNLLRKRLKSVARRSFRVAADFRVVENAATGTNLEVRWRRRD